MRSAFPVASKPPAWFGSKHQIADKLDVILDLL
jgi:hypothetical protein